MNQVSKQLSVAYGTVYNYAQKLKVTSDKKFAIWRHIIGWSSTPKI